MGRHTSNRLLRRVSGDGYLAPMKLDQSRPITSGAPLKRCSNKTSICLSAKEVSSIATASLRETNAIGEILDKHITKSRTNSAASFQSKSSKARSVIKSAVNNESKLSIALSSFKASEKYMVPTNTAISSSVITSTGKNTSTPGESSSRHEETENLCKMCIYDDGLSCATLQSMELMEKTDSHCKMANHKVRQQHLHIPSDILKGSDLNSVPHHEHITETVDTPSEDITTAASLDHRVSSTIVLSTPSEEWSLKFQATTEALSKGSSITDTIDNTETRGKSSCKTGDGDSIKTPPGSEKLSEEDSYAGVLPVPVPRTPASPAVSLVDKPSFMLTFKKPKRRPRPRSIVTKSCNKESLPSTASTPNPISPQICDSPKATEIGNDNNWDSENNNNNNNNVDSVNNNNETDMAEVVLKSSKEFVKGDVPKSVLSLREDTLKGMVVIKAMPIEVTTEPTTAVDNARASDVTNVEGVTSSNVYEPDDSFWHSDSTPSKNSEAKEKPLKKRSKTHNAHKITKPIDTTKRDSGSTKEAAADSTATTAATATGTSTSEDETGSTSKEESKSTVSKSYQPYPSNPSYSSRFDPSQPEEPFLRTEKGAIRFHLPGRIQHKTTIKVAHFPTGDERNVVLNVKPDKEEEVACEEMPSSLPPCANNQNFVVPPYPYNNSYYGYGGAAAAYAPPNYYGYYGYPPYY